MHGDSRAWGLVRCYRPAADSGQLPDLAPQDLTAPGLGQIREEHDALDTV